MAQLAPTATKPPQLLVSAKGPDRVILRGLSAALPVLVSVITCGALLVETVCAAKFRLVAERPTPGHSPIPVSVAVTIVGAGRVYVAVSVPVRVPGAVGLNHTEMSQDAPVLTYISDSQSSKMKKSPLTPMTGISPSTPLLGLT